MFLPSNITLKFGDSGDFVAELQRRLALVHCFSDDQVNGFYDGATVNGVTQFQAMNGLHADGMAGPETLRRLNGVIAGDTGSTSSDPKAEEEQAQATTANVVTNWLLDQNAVSPTDLPMVELEESRAEMKDLPAIETFAAAPNPTLLPDPIDAPLPLPMAAMPMDNPLVMFLNERPALTEPVASVEHERQSRAMQPDPLSIAMAATADAPAQSSTAPEPAVDVSQILPTAPQQKEPAAGLVHKTIRFTNSMMQKLADYFEAKLPPSVLHEVRQAGQIMASNGMKEAPIPTGPEAPVRAPEQLPTRGPEQQPQATR